MAMAMEMEIAAGAKALGTTFLLLLLFLLWHRVRINPRLKLPPSPPGSWPLLGHLLHLRPLAHTALQAMSNIRGPLITIRIGMLPCVVVSSAAAARECLITHGKVFASRPQPASWELFTDRWSTLTSAPYGDLWRSLRRIASVHLLNAKMIASHRSVRVRYVGRMIEELRVEAAASPSGSVKALASIRRCIICIFAWVYFDLEVEDASSEAIVSEIDANIKEVNSAIGTFSLGDCFPAIGWIFPTNRSYRQDLQRRTLALYRRLVDNVRQKNMQDVRNSDSPTKSYAQILLSLQNSAEEPVLSDDKILWLLQELMNAAVDTMANVLECGLAEITVNQQVQKKLQNEIMNTSTSGGEIQNVLQESDLQKLPYLEAVVKETLRLHSSSPMGLPHATTESSQIAGFDIPAGTQILFLLRGLSTDPSFWEDPKKFRPERFVEQPMEANGRNMNFIPFSAGKRICPGYSIAMLHLNYITGSLVQAFDWEAAPGGVDMSEKADSTVSLKTCFQPRIKPRII